MGPSGQREQRERESAVLLAWAGANGRPRREGEKGKELAHAGLWAKVEGGGQAARGGKKGLGRGERSQPEGEKRSRPGWARNWVCFPISFPFLFQTKTQTY
jgi:hypothetical protein